MNKNNTLCGKYRHYKSGNLYEVIGIARHSETHEEMIIYRALYRCSHFGDDQVWVRPKQMFLEHLEYNGKIVPRFMRIEL